MARDKRFFPDPEKFSPERHVDLSSLANKDEVEDGSMHARHEVDPSMIVFGFGRRWANSGAIIARVFWPVFSGKKYQSVSGKTLCGFYSLPCNRQRFGHFQHQPVREPREWNGGNSRVRVQVWYYQVIHCQLSISRLEWLNCNAFALLCEVVPRSPWHAKLVKEMSVDWHLLLVIGFILHSRGALTVCWITKDVEI